MILSLPTSWQVIGITLGSAVAVIAAFTFSISYSQTETAQGTVFPEGGLIEVMPPKSGKIDALLVSEGDEVREGTVLARVAADVEDTAGRDTQTAVVAALDEQDHDIALQRASNAAAARSADASYDAQITGYRGELQSIDAQIQIQKKLVDSAQEDFVAISEVAQRGFISKRDVATRQETLLLKQQQLASLMQSRTAKSAALGQTERAKNEAASKSAQADASLSSSGFQIAQARATAETERSFTLTAPVDGKVAAINVHRGSPTSADNPVMTIVPKGARLQAELQIPARSAARTHAGQQIEITFDAYPVERYGVAHAQIDSISSAPITKTFEGKSASVFIARAWLPASVVAVGAKARPVMPGMTFSARIVTERRTLISWLLDPLRAATR